MILPRGGVRTNGVTAIEVWARMTGKRITGEEGGSEEIEDGTMKTMVVKGRTNMVLVSTETSIVYIRWRNNDEEDYRGYRGSSSRRKPWDGDLD